MAEITEPLAKDDTCIDVEPAEIKSTGKRLPKDSGGGFEFVTSLPQEGGDSGVEYLLVDDAESPTQFFGGYMYEDENWIQTSLATNQLVAKVTELPETGEEGVLYYLEKEDETDTFDLYRWINEEWVKLDTDVKLYTTMGTNVDGSMTQKATTNMLYPEGEETTRRRVYIPIYGDLTRWGLQIGGKSGATTQSESIVIGRDAGSSGINQASVVIVGCRATTESAYGGVAIGYSAKAGGTLPVAIGRETYIPHTTTTKYGVALGYGSRVTQGRQSVMSIGSGLDNDWRTRIIENVTDPSLPQDAATKHYVDNLVIPTINLGTASSSSTLLSSTSFADIITQYPNSHIFKLDYDRATWMSQEFAYWYPNGSYQSPSTTNSIKVMKGAVMFVLWSDDAKTVCRGIIINEGNHSANNAPALTFYAAASTGWRMESYGIEHSIITQNGIMNLLSTRAAIISNEDWSTLWQ